MANSSKERLCGAGAPLGHANGFPPSVYPFAFSGGIRRSPPFEVLANGGFFRSFPTDLPKEMASLYFTPRCQKASPDCNWFHVCDWRHEVELVRARHCLGVVPQLEISTSAFEGGYDACGIYWPIYVAVSL
ncbi:hypothetical protein XELAEV_18013596mg [Xenopus laevis]|uniref:Uncharacterized protein n=1 Tax=Xenopus laevis TaxID=8355 RepID=A0A974DS81_XENLA|nr:hypothetical protein XELAEV_18013596mg [Xenopus laevis]